MTSHLWCWSDIVSPRAVEAAMADEERRARKRDRAFDHSARNDNDQPVAA